MAYGGIDFAPQPAPGSNPFEPVVQGINLGFGIQQQMREQQKFQADQLAAKAAAEKAKKDQAYVERERRQKDFKSGLELANDNAFIQGFSPEAINEVLNKQIKPYLVQDLGLPIDTELDYSQVKPIAKQFTAIMNSKATDEMKKKEIGKLMMIASPDQQKQLESASKVSFEKQGIARQTGRVTKDGLPVSFVPGMGYAYNDPATGEYTPYNEPTFAPSGNPSAGAETRLSEIYQQRFIVDEALDLLSPEAVGLLDRAYKNVGAYMDESSDPAALQFKSLTEMANTVIRNGYYGATLTNNEKKAFEDIALNRNLSPTAYLAKAKGLQTSFKKMEKGIRMAAQAANRPFRDAGVPTASPASEIESMSDEELKRIIEGK